MAMSDMASFLGRKGRRDFLGQLLVVSDSAPADGSYLLHYLLTQALKDGHAVVLVSFAQSFSHYSAIATKLGVNLAKCQDTEQLVSVDCLTQLLRRLWGDEDLKRSREGEEEEEAGTDQSGTKTCLTYSLDSDFLLRGLYQLIRVSITSLVNSKPDRPVCLVVDDLSTVLSMGVDVKAVVDFVHYSQQILCAPDGLCKGEGYMVAMVHCEVEEAEEVEGEGLLRTHLLHRCDLSLSVEGLKTGYSRDVHGEVKAKWRGSGREGERYLVEAGEGCAERTKCAQFKVTDRTVQLFAKGTSGAVL